jgi:hypothetical protein
MVRTYDLPYSEHFQAVCARSAHQIGVAPNHAPTSKYTKLTIQEKLSGAVHGVDCQLLLPEVEVA